ncbi:hypothetical protein GBA52_002852 [Prunus armeniaca]|nr:hypothetical protein GBA52_002852 [Prunus armeniaca]
MGTKMQCKSYLPGYYSVRDLNEDPNNCSWPVYYGDKTLSNRQYCNGFLPRATADAYPGYDKDVVKQTMLEHEAIFKNQVLELHRLYRIQRDLMDDIKRKELHRNQIPMETSLSSSPLVSQITSEDARKWHDSSFPLVNNVYAGPSIPGVEGIHSQSSAIKGNIPKNGLFPSQNGIISKDLEVMESRPTKVRKKMFDLQLPADVYIDSEEGEQFSDEKVSGTPSCQPNKGCKTALEGGTKLFSSNGGKTDCKGDALRSDSCSRSPNGLADLNEPIQFEETNASAYDYHLARDSCHGKIQRPDLAAKSRLQLLGLPKDISLDSRYVSDNVIQNNSQLENKGSGKGWFSHVLAGQSKSNLETVSECLQTERLPVSSQPMQVSINNVHEPTFYLTDRSKVDLWRERTVCGVENSERSHEISNSKHPSIFVASHMPSPYPILPSSDLAKSWTHSVSSWENPGSSLSQKSISVQTHPCLNSSATLSKSSQSSVQSNGIFGDRWYLNNHSSSNQGSGSEVPYQNGFHHGSSSGSKEPVRFPSLSCDYQSSSNNHNGGPEHLMSHGSTMHPKGSNCLDVKSGREVNLNVVLSNSSSNEEILQQGLKIIGGEQKHENHLAAFPWLRAKPASKNEFSNTGKVSKTGERGFFQSSMNNSSNKIEVGKDLNQIFAQDIKSVLSGNDVEARRNELGDIPCKRKLLGFPIFEKSHISKNESSSLTSPSVSISHQSERGGENTRRNRELDINLPCDPSAPELARKNVAEIVVVEEGRDTKVASFRHYIDLNSCISDDEVSLKPSVPSASVKITVEIDLEAPIVPETDDDVIPGETSAEKQKEISLALPQHTAEPPQDELVRVAAEAIVSISSSGPHNHMNESSCDPPEASSADPLLWFVEIASICGNDLESKFDTVLRGKDGEDNEESLSEEFDYFESMTLKLTETKEEDYMPKPLVPEDLKLEETGSTLPANQPRKGQSRRGRQRRDFQRDILPGLVSLSRHEVTEDLQTFGGLMRATGHAWHSGLTRRNSTRNGCGRGRRRAVVSPSPPVATSPACTPLVQQLNNTEMGLEDRSLTGWGKTTRRPRRQRCPAGNPPSVPLT